LSTATGAERRTEVGDKSPKNKNVKKPKKAVHTSAAATPKSER